MSKEDFSRKVAAVLVDYAASPIEVKAAVLTNLRCTLLTVKSRNVRKTLRKIEDFFKADLKNETLK